MIKLETRIPAKDLNSKIKSFVEENKYGKWTIDTFRLREFYKQVYGDRTYYKLNDDELQLQFEGWCKCVVEDDEPNKLYVKYVESTKYDFHKVTNSIYMLYMNRFVEMLIYHFGDDISSVDITYKLNDKAEIIYD